MTRIAAVFVGLLFVMAACGNGSGTSGISDVSCQDPPAEELSAESALDIVVTPNPAASGMEASLSVSGDGLAADAVTGAGAFWQCWNGSQWVDTHHMVKGESATYRTRAVTPGATVTIPAVGYLLPSSRAILIPDVPPGTYRIVDSVAVDGAVMTGFVLVQVR